jgi:hypothetical protein
MTVTAGGKAPSAGELTVFCRPVVAAPGGGPPGRTVLADAWLPDLVRLGELERHLGDDVIEAAWTPRTCPNRCSAGRHSAQGEATPAR